MRTKYIFLAGCILLAMNGTLAQPWDQGGNNIIATTDYLGCDGLSTFPLHLRTIPDLSIDMSTSDLLRMRLNPNQTSTLNGIYTGVVQNGFVGISDQPLFFGGPGPFSRLHLVDRGTGSGSAAHYAQQLGYRPWQRNGVTFTGNSDQAYVGQKYGMDGSGLLLQESMGRTGCASSSRPT